MNHISICRFNGLTGVEPFVYALNDLKQFVGFFTLKEPPTVKKEERREFFSMAIYKPDTTRAKGNVKALSGMVLDFDNTEDGSVRLPEFMATLKTLDLVYLYYTTWSHSSVRHRWRLILPFAKTVEVNFWPEAHSRVLKLLGNPVGIDEAASRDVARMWIMPCKATGQPYEIGYQISGNFLDPQTLPPSPSPVAKCLTPANPVSEFATMTPRDIREALEYIDPDTNYDIWLKIGMALQDQFGESGIHIWDTWSAKGSKYKNLKDLQTHWQSFRSNTGITIATLLHYAKERGYCRHNTATAYVGSSNHAVIKESLPEASLEPAEEVQEYADPIAQCVHALKPFAVKDIFDFPCA
ncbi:MAG: PriCT-2 domain-containing protein, partial [Alphaproteobacteria bacterium]